MDKLEELRDWIGELNWEGVEGVLSDAIDKINELNRPLVVPKELGKWLAHENLGSEGSLFSIIAGLEDMWVGGHFVDFINDNKGQLIEVILGIRPYEVEKEKLYYVIDKSKRPILTIHEGEIIASVSVSEVERAEKLSTSDFKYQLTEKQIKDYDGRYWSFAVEVAE